MKSKIQRALTAAIVGAVAAPVLMSVGCDAADESGSTEVLRTYQGQTEIVTVQTETGELQTVVFGAEGEERGQVIRDLEGNRTGSLDNAELSAELWNAMGDGLQSVHDLLHVLAQPPTEATDGAPAHPDSSAALAPDTDPTAANYFYSTCHYGYSSNGQPYGYAVEYADYAPFYSAAQCASLANSCSSSAVVVHHGTSPAVWSGSYGQYVTYCVFTTN